MIAMTSESMSVDPGSPLSKSLSAALSGCGRSFATLSWSSWSSLRVLGGGIPPGLTVGLSSRLLVSRRCRGDGGLVSLVCLGIGGQLELPASA